MNLLITKTGLSRASTARRHGMRHSVAIVREAKRAGLPYSLAFALVQQETGNGDNVFGHDPTIFVGGFDAKHNEHHRQVTRSAYSEYKRQRGPHGEGGMQGVGPTQLTFFSIQDTADRLGGCWRVGINLRVGFGDLAHLIRVCRGDVSLALAIYNGGAKHPNFSYAHSVENFEGDWKRRFKEEQA